MARNRKSESNKPETDKVVGSNTDVTAVLKPADNTEFAEKLADEQQRLGIPMYPPKAYTNSKADSTPETPVVSEPKVSSTDEGKVAPNSIVRQQLMKTYEFPDQPTALTEAKNLKVSRTLTDEQFGDGTQWLALKELENKHKANGMHSASIWAAAFGADRGMVDPVIPEYAFWWYKGKRYFKAIAGSAETEAKWAAFYESKRRKPKAETKKAATPKAETPAEGNGDANSIDMPIQ